MKRIRPRQHLSASASRVSRAFRYGFVAYDGSGGRRYAAEMVAQAEEIPETVLITGSLIRGTAAVGVPVVNLSLKDFAISSTLTASDGSSPAVQRESGPVATQAANNERGTRVNLRDSIRAPRADDDRRHPLPATRKRPLPISTLRSIPAFAIECLTARRRPTVRTALINIILKRNFDGAMVEAGVKMGKGGNTLLLCTPGPDLGRRPGHAELFMVRHCPHRWELPLGASPLITGLGASTIGDRSPPRHPARIPRAIRLGSRCPIRIIPADRSQTRTIPAISVRIARSLLSYAISARPGLPIGQPADRPQR